MLHPTKDPHIAQEFLCFKYAQEVHTLSDGMAGKLSSAEWAELELQCVAPVLRYLYCCAASKA